MSRCVAMRSAGKMTWMLPAMLASTMISTPRSMYGLYQAVASASATEHTRAVEQLLARPVTVDLDRVSLEQALDVVGARAGAQILYRAELISAYTTPVSLHTKRTPLGTTLAQILAPTPLQVVPLGGTRIMIVEDPRAKIAQEGTIVGTVTDAKTQRPLAGAKIVLHNADRAVTGEDGTYRITGVEAGTYSVTIKLLGYGKTVQTVTVADGIVTTLNMALEPSANTLEQVVVTGTIIPTELKAVPNAITVITAKQIEERGITRIDQLFRGDVPGLFVMNTGSNNTLDQVTMFSRGATSLGASAGTQNGTNPIKTYVDGVEMADPQWLSQIDPKSIERIEILTGPQASTIYGSNALNGVMQIFTKRGTTNTPQLTLNLLSGWVENNFSSARTPQHDYSAQLNGIEGRISYNIGGAWNYIGPWTPSKQTARMDGFGGTRLVLATPLGAVTGDVTLRRAVTQSRIRGDVNQGLTDYQASGWYSVADANGLSKPITVTLVGQTLGMTFGYQPMTWWSHEFGLGQDVSSTETRRTARGYLTTSDTGLSLLQSQTNRQSMHYTTTLRLPMTSRAQATLTAGADGWRSLATSLIAFPQTLTGSLTNVNDIERQPDHNTGGFLQTQLTVNDQLFLTYGLRAEWNPNFGRDAQPNYAPRYGVAYAHDWQTLLGPMTAKWRASYGRATRPPVRGYKVAVPISTIAPMWLPDYGKFDYTIANPELAPEYQRGAEGGLEVYWGTRGSVILTRYNQTVDGLIAAPKVDSVRSLTPNPTSGYDFVDANGYGYRYQSEYLNIGSIRNQGWEVQSSATMGVLRAKGTYSWTKSRVIGITPQYRSNPSFVNQTQYRPGASFQSFPEHTWAGGLTYAHAQTSVALMFSHIGPLRNGRDQFFIRNLTSFIRLPQNRMRVSAPSTYVKFNDGYTTADLNASRSLSARLDGVLQVQNLGNTYRSDDSNWYATMGRQTKIGFRIRT